MLQSVKIANEIADARYDAKRLAEDAGESYAYVAKLSQGAQGAGPKKLARLGRAMIIHAHRLLRLAARLLHGGEDHDAAEMARAYAGELEKAFGLHSQPPASRAALDAGRPRD